MEPDEGEGIGRIVRVFDGFKSPDGMLFVIQGNVDLIVHCLLPVLGMGDCDGCGGEKDEGYEFDQKVGLCQN